MSRYKISLNIYVCNSSSMSIVICLETFTLFPHLTSQFHSSLGSNILPRSITPFFKPPLPFWPLKNFKFCIDYYPTVWYYWGRVCLGVWWTTHRGWTWNPKGLLPYLSTLYPDPWALHCKEPYCRKSPIFYFTHTLSCLHIPYLNEIFIYVEYLRSISWCPEVQHLIPRYICL